MNLNNKSMHYRFAGFSLVEVVLAIGIFLITVLALVGLIGPTLQSVNEVEESDEIASIVNTINSYLQTAEEYLPNGTDSRFNVLFDSIADDGYATLIIYRWFDDAAAGTGPPVIRQEVGFADNQGGVVNNRGVVNNGTDADFTSAAGKIYRAVLTLSGITPEEHLNDGGEGSYPRYTLTSNLAAYTEGSLAFEVRIFSLEQDMQSVASGSLPTIVPTDLVDQEAAFIYTTAIVR